MIKGSRWNFVTINANPLLYVNANRLTRTYMAAFHKTWTYMTAFHVIVFYPLKIVSELFVSPIFGFLVKNYTIYHIGGLICLLGPGDL